MQPNDIECAPFLTPEQQYVINTVVNDPTHNYVLQGVPGAGKSTVIAEIAKQLNNGTSLQLTFSSALKQAGRARVKRSGVDNMHVHTFHSAAAGLFQRTRQCRTDADLVAFLDSAGEGKSVTRKVGELSTLFVDEAQDMTPLYLQVVRLILVSYGIRKIVVLGDWFQSIFRYNQSFTGCLEDPGMYLGGSWAPVLFLSTSFRIPPALCTWINQNLDPRRLKDHYPSTWQVHGPAITRFWANGIQGHPGHLKANAPEANVVREVIYSERDCVNGDTSAIDKALFDTGYRQGPIVILSQFGKTGHGLTPHIVNNFSNIQWMVKEGDAPYTLQDTASSNAGLVCSPHHFKGLETGYVVTNCSRSLENYFQHPPDPDQALTAYCEMYVAATRASGGLIINRDNSSEPFFTRREPPIIVSGTIGPHHRVRKSSLASAIKFGNPLSLGDRPSTEWKITYEPIISPLSPVDVSQRRQVKGIFPDTVEDIYPFLTRAIELALDLFRRTGKTITLATDWKDAVWKVLDDIGGQFGYRHLQRQIPTSFDWVDASFMQEMLCRARLLLDVVTDIQSCTPRSAKLPVDDMMVSIPPVLWQEQKQELVLIDWATEIPPDTLSGNKIPVFASIAYKAQLCHIVYPVPGCFRSIRVR